VPLRGTPGRMSAFAHAPWVAPMLSAVVTAIVLGLLSWHSTRLPLDYPSGRSLHDRPVARVGGIAIWAGFLPVALLSAGSFADNIPWLGPWAIVTAVSFADDWFGVRAVVRLVVQTIAALAFALALPANAAEGMSTAHVLASIAIALAVAFQAAGESSCRKIDLLFDTGILALLLQHQTQSEIAIPESLAIGAAEIGKILEFGKSILRQAQRRAVRRETAARAETVIVG